MKLLPGTPVKGLDLGGIQDEAVKGAFMDLIRLLEKMQIDIARVVNANEPATTGAWTEIQGGVGFQNGWANFGGAYNTAAARLDADGTVRLKGLIAGGTLGLTAFTLPAAYRPATKLQLFAASSLGLGTGVVQIDTSGNLIPNGASNTYVTLDGLTYSLTS